MSLEGRLALVTGGGLRIGRRVVERLAAAGADVIVHYHTSTDAARDAAKAVEAAGGRAHLLSCDLDDPAAAARLVPDAAATAGRPVDILVNSASSFRETTMKDMQFAHLEADVRLNAWAPFALARAVAAQGVEASVVNLLDTRITDTDARHVPYILAKKMLTELTRMCARAYAPRVRVNAVAPGPILPPPGKAPDDIAHLASRVPLQRLGTPDDVADAVLYLCGATYTTGQVLFVDGGRHVR